MHLLSVDYLKLMSDSVDGLQMQLDNYINILKYRSALIRTRT